MFGALYWIAKGMQLTGLAMLPLAIFIGLGNGNFVAETWLAGLGVAAFFTGLVIERKVGRKPDRQG